MLDLKPKFRVRLRDGTEGDKKWLRASMKRVTSVFP